MELLAGKMAYGDYASIIKEALDEDLVWNQGNIDLNSSDYGDKDNKGEYKDSEDLNIPRGIVEWSPSSTPIDGWSPTPILGVLMPLAPSRSLSVSLLILLSSIS